MPTTPDYKAHARRIGTILLRYWPAFVEAGGKDAVRKVAAGIAFDLTPAHIQDVKKQIALRAKGMSDTTRDDIQRIVTQAQERTTDNSTEAIAKELREAGVTSSRSRSELISRTESATAYNQGAIMGYHEAGVEKVEALDSDEDEECAARNGQIYTLEEAAAIEPHPNCVLAWLPVVGD